MDNQTRPGLAEFYSGLKQIKPDVSDQEVIVAYDEFKAAAGNPQAIQAAVSRLTRMPVSASTELPNTPNLPTQLKSPMAGTTQEAANPLNPLASAQSQFDPLALQNAQAEYAARAARNQPGMSAGNLVMGMGGSAVNDAYEARRKAIDERDQLQTLGAQKALQEQATAGTANAQAIQNITKGQGDFTTNQAKAILEQAGTKSDLITKNLSVEQQQRMNKTNSPETMLAKSLLLSQINSMAPTDKAEIARIVNQPGVTAAQLIPAMAQFAPNAHKAYLEQLGGNKTIAETGAVQAGTGRVQAETPGVAAESRIKGGVANTIVPSNQASADREALAIIKSEYDREKDPSVKASLFREMTRVIDKINKNGTAPKLEMPSGSNMNISAGGVTISPDPGKLAEQKGAGDQKVASQEQFKNYQTIVKPKIDDTIEYLTRNYTGKGAGILAAYLPDNEQQMVASALNQLNATYPTVLPAEISRQLIAQSGKQGFNGTFQLPLSQAQSIKMLNDAKANVERLQEYQTKSNEFEAKGNKPSSFYNTPEAQNVGKSIPMKKNGKTFDIPANRVEEALAKGYTR